MCRLALRNLADAAEEFRKVFKTATLSDSLNMWYWDFKERIWKPNAEALLMSWTREEIPNITKTDFNELKFQLQRYSIIDREVFKPDPMILNFQGKALNLDGLMIEDEVRPFSYSRKRLDTELCDNAPPPKIFLDCLEKAIPDGKDRFHCLQAFSSLLLIRTMRIEKAFFFLGSGGNGKSTIMKAVENIFENYISHVDLADLVGDSFSAGALVDKLANVYADIQTLKFKDMAIFKAISSGDTISVNEKYQPRRDETIKVIQIYSANKMPTVDDKNPGFMRRVSPIVFDMQIKDHDPLIDDKLNDPEERKRILSMLVRVARFTRKHGFIFEKSKEEIERILEDKEEPIIQFINDDQFIHQGQEYEIERTKLYNLYRGWCKTMNIIPKTMSTFSRYISNRGFDSRMSSGKRIWQGIGLEVREDLKSEENQTLDS